MCSLSSQTSSALFYPYFYLRSHKAVEALSSFTPKFYSLPSLPSSKAISTFWGICGSSAHLLLSKSMCISWHIVTKYTNRVHCFCSSVAASPAVQEARSLKSVGSRGSSFLPLPACGGHSCALSCGDVPPGSASVCTGPSLLSLCLVCLVKGHLSLNLGPPYSRMTSF